MEMRTRFAEYLNDSGVKILFPLVVLIIGSRDYNSYSVAGALICGQIKYTEYP
jgi:hypothetical protein